MEFNTPGISVSSECVSIFLRKSESKFRPKIDTQFQIRARGFVYSVTYMGCFMDFEGFPYYIVPFVIDSILEPKEEVKKNESEENRDRGGRGDDEDQPG